MKNAFHRWDAFLNGTAGTRLQKKLPDFKFWRKHFFELLTSQVYREASISSLVSFEAFHQKDVDRYFERGWTRNMTVVEIWQGKAASEQEITGKSNFIQHLELFYPGNLKITPALLGNLTFSKNVSLLEMLRIFLFSFEILPLRNKVVSR